MLKNIDYEQARDLMLERALPVGTERVSINESCGRVLAEGLKAGADVPPFDRSPFDGYAFRTADTAGASRENPVTLRILEEVPAGSVPTMPVTEGTATKILTGSPVPDGADGIVKYEVTEFTAETVKLFEPVTAHDIVRRGEDVKAGTELAKAGSVIDPALLGTLASQGIAEPLVYRKVRVGIISTGNELVEVGQPLTGGKIHDSNRYVLEGVVCGTGAEPVFLGTARDTEEEIAALIAKGLESCDAVFTTGGASVGDYDATPRAMELAGVELLVRKLNIKPGGACAYGLGGGKPVMCLSGNPAAAAVNLYAVGIPLIRRLMGLTDCLHIETELILADGFKKKSPQTRLLRGRLEYTGEGLAIRTGGQGNAMLHAMIGCNALAIVPEGSPPIPAGTKLKGYIL